MDPIPLPAFQDNYIWLLPGEPDAANCLVVDPGCAEPVLSFLEKTGARLEAILLTHHHPDHVGGVQDLLRSHPVPVYGPRDPRMPMVTHVLRDGEEFAAAGKSFTALATPGHTATHISYVTEHALFCGDTLFSLGCGRVFDGSVAQLCSSLQKLAALPPSLLVCAAHEYTQRNCEFALMLDPGHLALKRKYHGILQQRANSEPTLPSSIAIERALNPFLQCDDPAMVERLQRIADKTLSSPLETFTAMRALKDRF